MACLVAFNTQRTFVIQWSAHYERGNNKKKKPSVNFLVFPDQKPLYFVCWPYVHVRGIDIVKQLKWMNVIERRDYFMGLY